MSRGFSQTDAYGITRHYDSNGNMTGYSQRNGHGGYDHYDNRGNKRR